MITPVENGSTCAAEHPSRRASSLQVWRAAAMPSLPVPALAQPVLTSSARTDASGSSIVKCWRATVTGAAQKRFCVKTPATRAPLSSFITSRSLRFALRIPASATPRPTPLTGNRLFGSGGFRLTGMDAGGRVEPREL